MTEQVNVDDVIEAMLADAVADMTKQAGGTAVCVFTKAGTSVPGVKYAEGRWASLREIQRTVKKGVTHLSAVTASAEKWNAKLTSLEERGANKDWLAYHHGGVDALAELHDILVGKPRHQRNTTVVGIDLTPRIQL